MRGETKLRKSPSHPYLLQNAISQFRLPLLGRQDHSAIRCTPLHLSGDGLQFCFAHCGQTFAAFSIALCLHFAVELFKSATWFVILAASRSANFIRHFIS